MSVPTSVAASTSGGLREAMSCDVCSEVYERTLKTPLVLPCGHTFCRACLTALKKTGRFLCPTCRVQHNVQVESLTVNYTLLNVLPFCDDFMHDKCNTHGDDLRYWCCTCELPLCSLCLYSGHPQGHTIKLAQAFVEDKKLELSEKIKLFFANIESQKKELKGDFNNLDADMKKLFHKNACLQDKLTALGDLQAETLKASDITSVKYYEGLVKHFQCKERDEPSGTDVPRGEKGSGTDVPRGEKGKEPQGAEAFTKCLESSKVQKLFSSFVFSPNQEITTAQHAIMDFREGRLLLYSVASPASKGLSFQVPSEVFLELSVGDRCLGRVFISLWCDMRRAQQMLILCMGTMKQSLLNTKAEKHGNYLAFKNIAGNQPLITSLEWGGQCTKPETEGYVTGMDFGSNRANSAAFGICTKPETEGYVRGMDFGSNRANSAAFGICTKRTVNASMHGPFGKVVKGLEVVEAAFQHNPITDVTITNSGLVVPGLAL